MAGASPGSDLSGCPPIGSPPVIPSPHQSLTTIVGNNRGPTTELPGKNSDATSKNGPSVPETSSRPTLMTADAGKMAARLSAGVALAAVAILL